MVFILVFTVVKELFRLVISWDWLLRFSSVFSTLLVKSLNADESAFKFKLLSTWFKVLSNLNKSSLTEVTFPSTLTTLLLRSSNAEALAFTATSFLVKSISDCKSVIRLPWLVILSPCWDVVDSNELIAEELADTLGSETKSQYKPLYLFNSLFFPKVLLTHKSPETTFSVGILGW